MARILFVHWGDKAEGERVRLDLEQDGHDVRVETEPPSALWKVVRDDPADALVISLRGKPRWARELAGATRNNRFKDRPIIFLDGGGGVSSGEVADELRSRYPEGHFADRERLPLVLSQVLGP